MSNKYRNSELNYHPVASNNSSSDYNNYASASNNSSSDYNSYTVASNYSSASNYQQQQQQQQPQCDDLDILNQAVSLAVILSF